MPVPLLLHTYNIAWWVFSSLKLSLRVLQDAIVDNVCQGGSLAAALQGNSPSEAAVLIGGLPGSCCAGRQMLT